MDIAGKNILVAGGFGAMGTAVAEALAAAGAHISIFDLNSSDAANAYVVDTADEADVERALAVLPKIDALVNCAGEIYSEPLLNVLKKSRHGRDSWDRVMRSNLTSAFNLSVQVAQKMAAQRVKGVIINFSSISAHGNAGQAAYSAAKAGVEAMTTVLAKELGMFKIRAVAIAPGFIDTASTRASLSEDLVEYWTRETPLRRLGELADIVKTVKYALECDHLTGCVLRVDGGLRL